MKQGGEVHKWFADNSNGGKSCIDQGCSIHSVRRLSDGEVFSIGNEIITLGNKREKITGFQMKDNWDGGMGVMYGIYDGDSIRIAEKAPKPECLFTTEDGKEALEGGRIHFVDLQDYTANCIWNIHGDIRKQYPNYKFFSTEQAANEYILMNKPIFSLGNVMERYLGDQAHDYFCRMKEAAQSKINPL